MNGTPFVRSSDGGDDPHRTRGEARVEASARPRAPRRRAARAPKFPVDISRHTRPFARALRHHPSAPARAGPQRLAAQAPLQRCTARGGGAGCSERPTGGDHRSAAGFPPREGARPAGDVAHLARWSARPNGNGQCRGRRRRCRGARQPESLENLRRGRDRADRRRPRCASAHRARRKAPRSAPDGRPDEDRAGARHSRPPLEAAEERRRTDPPLRRAVLRRPAHGRPWCPSRHGHRAGARPARRGPPVACAPSCGTADDRARMGRGGARGTRLAWSGTRTPA